MQIWSFFFILFFVYSCTTKHQANNSEDVQKYELVRTDSVVVFPLDEFSNANMAMAASLTENGKQYLCLYQNKKHSFQIFDFEKQSLMKEIALSKDGVNGINSVANYTFIDSKNIILCEQDSKNLFWLNDKGEIIKKITLPSQIPPFAQDGYVISLGNYQNFICYDKKREVLYLPADCLNYLKAEYYKRKVILRVEKPFDTNFKITWVGSFPEICQNENIFAGSHEFSLTDTDSDIIIGFSASPQICKINKASAEHHFVESNMPDNLSIEPLYSAENEISSDFSLHMQKEIEHRMTAAYFCDTKTTPDKKMIYRIFKEKNSTQKSDGTLPELFDAPHHIYCYNENMQVLASTVLDKTTSEGFFQLPVKDGIFVYRRNDESDDSLTLLFIRLQKI
jgi:hypothetical protein